MMGCPWSNKYISLFAARYILFSKSNINWTCTITEGDLMIFIKQIGWLLIKSLFCVLYV